MADVAISRPAANEKQTIQSQPDAKYIFDFQAGDATITRDGNNLLLNFDDGAGVAIENFYETHTQESMPSFQIDGQEVAGQAFFEALNEPDLMPAAGPAAAAAPERGGRYNEYGNSDLAGGLDHLTRLEYRSDRGFEWENPNWITSPDWDGAYLAGTGATGPLVADSLRPGTPDTSGLPPLATTRPEPTPPHDLDTPDYPAPPVNTPPISSVTPPPGEPGVPERPVTPPATPDVPRTPSPDPGRPGRPDEPEDPNETPDLDPNPGPEPNNPNVPPKPNDPDNDPAKPDKPGDPSDPANPDPGKPDPGKPNNPSDPDNPDPDDPGKPDDPNPGLQTPILSGAPIVVDEGALPGSAGNHSMHGHAGSYYFLVNTHGEGGTVTLTHGGVEVKISINETGSPAAAISEADLAKSFMVDGVRVQITGASQHLDADGNWTGQWDVHYDYALEQTQYHDQAALNPAPEDEAAISQDQAIFGNGIDITVVDGKYNDEASGKLTVEVHDDVPVINAIADNSVVFNGVRYNYGADNELYDGHTAGDALNVTVTEGGTVLEWTTPSGVATDISDLAAGDVWTAGEIEISRNDAGDIIFAYRDGLEKKADHDLDVRIVDADGDVASTALRMQVPTITPPPVVDDNPPSDPDNPPKDPDDPNPPVDPENPPKDPDDPHEPEDPKEDPNDPESPAFTPASGHSHVVVDEGALQAGAGHHNIHEASGSKSFNTHIPYEEGGTITLTGIGANGQELTLTFTVPAHETDPANVTVESGSFVASGVTLENFTIARAEGSGNWKVNFDYRLNDAQKHDHANTPITEDNYAESFSSDEVNYAHNAIRIDVTDGTGDHVSDYIHVEVHDDVPVLTVSPDGVLKYEAPLLSDAIPGHEYIVTSETAFTGKFEASFGADGQANTNALTINGKPFDMGTGQLEYVDRGENGQILGVLNISRNDDGTFRYEYEPVDGAAPTDRTFEVVVTDGDADQDPGKINVYHNYKPDIVPIDPEDPKNPDDPDHDPVNYDPKINGLVITVDEAALANGTGGSGDTGHGYAGTASFVAKFNGGEDGTITIGNDYVIKVTNNNGHYEFEAGKGELKIGGVKVSFDPARITANDLGEIKVEFSYELTGARTHNNEDSVGADDALLTDTIPVKITDSVRGDPATSGIRFEIHDDGPVISVTQGYDTRGQWETTDEHGEAQVVKYTANLSGTVDMAYGADDRATTDAMTINGHPVNYENGVYTYDDGQGILTIRPDVTTGKFTYEYAPNHHNSFTNKTFNVEIKDADGDTAHAPIVVYQNGDPTFIPNEQPKDPVEWDPATNSLTITVDEKDWALKTGEAQAGTGDTAHPYMGKASFDVKVNEDGGTIVIGEGENSVTITIDGDGKVTNSGAATINVGGVELNFAKSEVTQNDDGSWKISFGYELDKAVTHDRPGFVGSADTLSNSIAITVTDASGGHDENGDKLSGGTVHGSIIINVHDDGPMISASRDVDIKKNWTEKDADGNDQNVEYWANLTGTLKLNYGADGPNKEQAFTINGEKVASQEDGAYKYSDGQGTLTISQINGGEWQYEYTPKDPHAQFANKTFDVKITDADKDTASATISVYQDLETHPDPGAPTEPVEWDPKTGSLTITVDEKDWAQANGKETGTGDIDHPYQGTASFTVQLNGEGGTIVVGEGENSVTFTIGADGSVTTSKTTTIKAGTEAEPGAIELNFATGNVTQNASGAWTVSFDYKLTDAVAHGNSEAVGAADSLGLPEIPITVTDSFGGYDADGNRLDGKTVEGSIKIEIHDDGPEITTVTADGKGAITDTKITENPELVDGSLTGTFAGKYGADGQNASAALLVKGTDGEFHTGTAVTDTTNAYEFAVEGGKLTITDNGDGSFAYEYAPENKNLSFADRKFDVKIVDGDNDAAETKLTVNLNYKPNTTHEEKPKDPDDPNDPDSKEIWAEDGHIVVDEGALTNGTQVHNEHGLTGKGAFNVDLHGEGGTITLGQAGSNNLVITVKEDGTVEFAGGSFSQGGVTVTFDKNCVTDNEDGTYSVKYSYVLEEADKHQNADSAGKSGANDSRIVPNITINVTDTLGENIADEQLITITVHDDAPAPTFEGLNAINVTEGSGEKATADITGAMANAGADREKSHAFQLQLKGQPDENGEIESGLTAIIGEGRDEFSVMLSMQGEQVVGKADNQVVFTVSIDSASGKVAFDPVQGISIKQEQDKTGKHEMQSAELKGIQAVYKVTDTDDDTTSTEPKDITILINDTQAHLINFENTNITRGDEYRSVMIVDFIKQGKMCEALGRGQKYINKELENATTTGNLGEIDFWGAHIAYTVDDQGHINWLADHYSHFGLNTGGNLKLPEDIYAKITSNGLGVGEGQNSPGGGSEIGIGNELVTSLQNGQSYWKYKNDTYGIKNQNITAHELRNNAWHSEGIVIDPKNGGVNYGLNVTFNHFDANDKVVIAFYLTPNNNNDNNIVKIVEYSATDGVSYSQTNGGTLTVNVKVPDGFTKAIIAPMPNANETTVGSSQSDFYIEKIEFAAPCFTRGGSFEIDTGTDAATFKDVQWDWSQIKGILESKGVDIEDSIGAGHYDIALEQEGDHIKATLAGKSGLYGLNGKLLFDANLNDDGTWEINQFYKFKMDGGKDPSKELCEVKFTVTDADGSVSTSSHGIDLRLETSVDRFDNVEVGYWDEDVSGKAEPEWDTVDDVLTGHGTNDLMYGRGGNDIMFGDALDKNGWTNFNTFKNLVLGNNQYKNPQQWNDALAGQVEPGENGLNADLNKAIFDKLEALVKNGEEHALKQLDDIIDKAEGLAAGDDALFGGTGNDILFGGKGNDYLHGAGHAMDSNWTQTDHNMLFGGSGNDILVYNAHSKFYETNKQHANYQGDIIADGGRDIDILLVGSTYAEGTQALGAQTKLTLEEMLNGIKEDSNGPLVRNIEVMFRTNKSDDPTTSGITSLESLLTVGVLIANNKVFLDMGMWTLNEAPQDSEAEKKPYATNTYSSVKGDTRGPDYTLEITQSTDQHVIDSATFADYVKNGVPADITSASELDQLLPDEEVATFGMFRNEGPGLFKISKGDDVGRFLVSDDEDRLFGGAGNDILIIDGNDIFIDGGMNVDIVVTADANLSLKEMLELGKDGEPDAETTTPAMRDVEVLIKGEALAGIASADELADKYGVKFTDDGKGIELGAGWTPAPVVPDTVTDASNDAIQVATYEYATADGGTLTLETTLVRPPHAEAGDAQDSENPEDILVGEGEGNDQAADTADEDKDQDEADANESIAQNDQETDITGDTTDADANEAGEPTDQTEPTEAGDTVSAELTGTEQSDAADQLGQVSEELTSAGQPEAELNAKPEAAEATAGAAGPEAGDAVAEADGNAEPETAPAADKASGTITLVTQEEHDRLVAEQEKEEQKPEIQNVVAEPDFVEVIIPDMPVTEQSYDSQNPFQGNTAAE